MFTGKVFHCIVCREDKDAFTTGYKLSCGHIFCHGCIRDFVQSKLRQNKHRIKCFHPVGKQSCNVDIADRDIKSILSLSFDSNGLNLSLQKYEKLKYLFENKLTARSCPSCECVVLKTSNSNEMHCTYCSSNFCFVHCEAHKFNRIENCATYNEKKSK